MGFSIQDYLKKINSRITTLNCVSLLVTTLFLSLFTIHLYVKREHGRVPVSYYVNSTESTITAVKEDSRPFGSVKGKTYTFSWCGGQRTKPENRIYFDNEEIAKGEGRVLSKLCK